MTQPDDRDQAGTDAPFRRELGLADFTLLVIGAIVGDGVYVLSSMGAASLGPAQLLAWLAAGVLAGFIILAFVQCAAIDQEVGGSYSYARLAFGPFVGFIAGWALYAGEWVAISAFPLAFFNYFRALTGAGDELALPVKLALVGAVTGINLIGIRQGARTNDALTVAKLLPLALLVILGLVFLATHRAEATDHLQPFAPVGWSQFGDAVLPIFWAFAGFELAVLPAGEVRSPARTLPRGLIIGLAIATAFYLLTILAVVIALPWQTTAQSSHPLAAAMEALVVALGGPPRFGEKLLSLGGLISIAGVFVVFMLALARLTYALAKDGLLPSRFAALHPRFGTPWSGLLFHALSAILFSTLFDLRSLLSTAVLFLSISYLLTALSAIRLVQRNPAKALHLPGLRVLLVLGAAASVYLTAQASPRQAVVAGSGILGGAVWYVVRKRMLGRPLAADELPQPAPALHPHGPHPHVWLLRSVGGILHRRHPS